MRPERVKGEKTIYRARTKKQTIDITRLPDGSYALYLDGHVQFVSGPDEKIYHEALVTVPGKMLAGKPLRVLILGGGDGLAARNALALPAVKEIVNVEYDPGMVAAARKHPVLRSLNRGSFLNRRVRVQVEDAREFVSRQPTRLFNFAILDFPDPTDQFTDLYSQSFYEALVKHLDPAGFVIAVQGSDRESETERMVAEGLEGAARARPKVIRFKGTWMHNGTIVIVKGGGGHGEPRR